MGVAHFDNKPENVLVDEQFNILLCDFGSSIYEVPGVKNMY